MELLSPTLKRQRLYLRPSTTENTGHQSLWLQLMRRMLSAKKNKMRKPGVPPCTKHSVSKEGVHSERSIPLSLPPAQKPWLRDLAWEEKHMVQLRAPNFFLRKQTDFLYNLVWTSSSSKTVSKNGNCGERPLEGHWCWSYKILWNR